MPVIDLSCYEQMSNSPLPHLPFGEPPPIRRLDAASHYADNTHAPQQFAWTELEHEFAERVKRRKNMVKGTIVELMYLWILPKFVGTVPRNTRGRVVRRSTGGRILVKFDGYNKGVVVRTTSLRLVGRAVTPMYGSIE